MTPKSQRSLGSNRHRNNPIPEVPSHANKPDTSFKAAKGVHFYPLSSRQSVTAKQNQQARTSPVKAEVPHIKVNIRRPRAGAKHWFDGLEGDSSDEGSIHEPEFHQSFVAGMEMAFEAGSIGMKSTDTDSTARLPSEGPAQNDRAQHKPRSMSKPPSIPPRVSTLNAKSSRSTLSQTSTARSQPRIKAGSLASTDLQHTSVLDLSSSDDEEPSCQSKPPQKNPLPRLRDSIAIDGIHESEIEVGTAKAIDTKQNFCIKATPSVRRVNGAPPQRKTGLSAKRHSQAQSYFSDRSSGQIVGNHDLLTSFPATPTETVASQRTSLQMSDTASVESRRLMSVTRQEESLLAAMRLKRSALNQPRTRTADRRVLAVKAEERPLRQPYQAYKSPAALEVLMSQQNNRFDVPRSNYPEKSFDQASCTTFQTGTGASVDPSVRLSIASYQTDTSVETETEIMSQMSLASPPYNHNVNRISRSTFFSSSSGTNDSLDQSYNLKQNAYRTTLDKLRQVPTRDEVSSQDFIDWPYQGWEVRSKLGTAH